MSRCARSQRKSTHATFQQALATRRGNYSKSLVFDMERRDGVKWESAVVTAKHQPGSLFSVGRQLKGHSNTIPRPRVASCDKIIQRIIGVVPSV